MKYTIKNHDKKILTFLDLPRGEYFMFRDTYKGHIFRKFYVGNAIHCMNVGDATVLFLNKEDKEKLEVIVMVQEQEATFKENYEISNR